MSKNFKNPLQIFNVCLFAGVLGLTYMNTSYIPAKQASEKVTIYVAAEDINPNVDLTSYMFVPTTINKADLLPGYITDVAVLENVYSNTTIYKNEPDEYSTCFNSGIPIENFKNYISDNIKKQRYYEKPFGIDYRALLGTRVQRPQGGAGED